MDLDEGVADVRVPAPRDRRDRRGGKDVPARGDVSRGGQHEALRRKPHSLSIRRPGDDLLDVVLFTSASRVTLFRFYQLLSQKKAGQLSLPGVVRFPAREFRVLSLAGYEVEVQVDGEGCGTTPLAVGPTLGRVNVVVPE